MLNYEISSGGAMTLMAVILAFIFLAPLMVQVAPEVVPAGTEATLASASRAVFPFSGLFPGIGLGISFGMWVVVVFLFSYFAQGAKLWQVVLAAMATIALWTAVLHWSLEAVGVTFTVR
jgi:hypothetical protein